MWVFGHYNPETKLGANQTFRDTLVEKSSALNPAPLAAGYHSHGTVPPSPKDFPKIHLIDHPT